MRRIIDTVLNFIWKILGGIAVIFAGIAIFANFLFTPKLFQKLMKLFSKKVFITITLIIVVLAGGIFAWQYFGAPGEKVKNETADWQTYRNEEFGFEIKYPKDWIFNPDVMSFNFSSGETIKGSDGFSCSLNVALAVKGANAEHINSLPKEQWQKSDVNIDGKSAIKLVSVDSPIKAYYFLENSGEHSFQIYHSTTRYITNQEGYKVALGFIYDQECMDIFNQMLSNFRFIEGGETANWEIYKNEEYGFEMKYPEDFLPTQPLQPKTKIIQCDYANFVNNCTTEKTIIDGLLFCLQKTSEGAAGTTYITYNYTTVRDRECFVVSFTVPYSNCSNYLPIESQEIQQMYDKCKLDEEVTKPETINQILSTFKFLE
ncbi:MAG: hypothetical protein COS26_01450 [Candidatus Nealsonbacteria bacterium CG02_land_8_20_14_3_00_40_11]|uniref:Uncharacterized protein n=1 Tax=Candidatus Nealsonbacteria bacterium CG02_land_8_20_14_3_00_40_11 TaxID=1974700 RepID=A0A2M7D822_9BACT|nr:MAG: hypothetical protein COS26_01450 [Candidatus Nealsonbacteria bacterium CG02_land_8_20_14_3_00_40_11]